MLITHEPPFGTLDRPHIMAKHGGCQYLLGAVLRVKPRGSISSGIFTAVMAGSLPGVDDAVNCAVVDNARTLANAPMVVELTR